MAKNRIRRTEGTGRERTRHVDGLKIPSFNRSSRSVTVTQDIGPDEAQTIVQQDNFGGQRRLNQQFIQRLANAMWRGKFLDSSQIRLAALGGKRVLVDGQHRLWAVIMSKTTQRFVVTVTPVEKLEEIRELYAEIDQGRPRSYFEVYRSLDLHGKLNLKAGEVSKIGSAAPYVVGGFDREMMWKASKVRDLRVTFIEDYANEARIVLDAIAKGSNKIRAKICMGPVFGVALVTATYKPRKCVEFWSGVADVSGLETRDPRFRFRDYLLSEDGKTRRNVEWSHLAANAWNSFVAGGTVRTMFVKTIKKAIRIRECPNYTSGSAIHLPYGDFTDARWQKPKWETASEKAPDQETMEKSLSKNE